MTDKNSKTAAQQLPGFVTAKPNDPARRTAGRGRNTTRGNRT